MAEYISNAATSILAVFRAARIPDILDIAIVAFIIYEAIKLIRQTRAQSLMKGIIILAVISLFANVLGMETLRFLMDNLFPYIVFGLIVIFQPELRRIIEQLGRTRLGTIKWFGFASPIEDTARLSRIAIDEVCASVTVLQRQSTGALIVFENKVSLQEFSKTGTIVNADPSSELICNIFYNKAPLHDGAVIIREGKVYVASCVLPLSRDDRLSNDLGMRHRAALGVSEVSDALAVVVSEETSRLSVAENGTLHHNLSVDALRVMLTDIFVGEETDSSTEKEKKKKNKIFRSTKGE